MAPDPIYRDVIPTNDSTARDGGEGKQYVAVIGINRYRKWDRLHNAVADAEGVLTAFEKLSEAELMSLAARSRAPR